MWSDTLRPKVHYRVYISPQLALHWQSTLPHKIHSNIILKCTSCCHTCWIGCNPRQLCRPCDQDKEVTGHEQKEYVRNLRGTASEIPKDTWENNISRIWYVLLWIGLMWLRLGLVNMLTSLQIQNDVNTNCEKRVMQWNKQTNKRLCLIQLKIEQFYDTGLTL